MIGSLGGLRGKAAGPAKGRFGLGRPRGHNLGRQLILRPRKTRGTAGPGAQPRDSSWAFSPARTRTNQEALYISSSMAGPRRTGLVLVN